MYSNADKIIKRFKMEMNEKNRGQSKGRNGIFPSKNSNNLPVIYLFGAGDISGFIAKFAKAVGFYVVLVDNSSEFGNEEKVPDADEIILQEFHSVFGSLRFTGKEFVVIVTREHEYDECVLGEVLKRQTGYIGMMGNKRRVNAMMDRMKRNGFNDEVLKKVHTPIGLDINAKTLAEIAIGIVAEIIKVKNYKS
jgi:xanthine dehydrogenase accessory factor